MNYFYVARSDFSLGQSLLGPKKIAYIAKRDNVKTVALCDTMTISGMTDFVSACNSEGINYIIGCRLCVVMDLDYRKPKRSDLALPKPNPEFYPKVYVKNEQGMFELMRLLSLANSDESGRFHDKARINLNDLIQVLKIGNLAFSTGDLGSVFMVREKEYNWQTIMKYIASEIPHENLFCELFNADSILYAKYNKNALECAVANNLNIITSNLTLYDEQADMVALDALSAIVSNNKITDSWRSIQQLNCLHSKSDPQMHKECGELFAKLCADYPPSLDLSLSNQALIDSCSYKWQQQPISLPKIVADETKELERLVVEGWKKRIKKPIMGYKPPDDLIYKYKARLHYELGTLKKLGFERYFILVSDLVRWSKQNGIMVGPARGSCAGSLVAYLLEITDIDPIRFNLIFERFINPERLDLPDADLDFMSTRRMEVIDYLIEKYGKEKVAGISNYGTLASASAFRDCGRVFSLTPEQMEATKYVPKENGTSYELEVAAEAVPEIQALKEAHPKIWSIATKLEGVMRSLGKHAAGVVVADEPLVNRCVVESRAGAQTVNWDRMSVESWGLVKVDILGLNTLDTLRITLDYIKENRGEVINLLDIPLGDEETMEAFSRAQTVGIFQLESSSMRSILKRLAKGGRLTFDDICATTSLNRPGPLESGMCEAYIKWRQGIEDPEYAHPSMIPALESTGGTMVYQEQTMQIVRDLAGFSMAEADLVRKAIGKKDHDKMKKIKGGFIEGCIRTSHITEAQADKIWQDIEKNASYQFNLSHAVSYSVISYWCGYLKTHYAPEFFAATLTTIDDEGKLQSILFDAQRHKINVMPPDINISSHKFVIQKKDEGYQLVAPFNKLKGVSDKTTAAILEAREKVGGKFKSINHLLENVARRSCNVGHVKVLDTVGAFANIEPGQLPVKHPDRIKDQIELLPGLINDLVKTSKVTSLSDITLPASALIRGIRSCDKCSLKELQHCIPVAGNKITYMVITDAPNTSESNEGKMLQGDSCNTLITAIKDAGLRKTNGYFTSLVKVKKPKELKMFANETLIPCGKLLSEEIKMVNPGVIVALGGAAIRYLLPELKGGWEELAGKVYYSKTLDCSVVCGPNPQMAFFREEIPGILQNVFEKVYEMTT
jgi:DNA polymerase-3 subunit alpha